uniref:Uncharacterized protein n=1 Tax=Tetranychus urticae TaxID=32264 RepID=T1KL41_TETUR
MKSSFRFFLYFLVILICASLTTSALGCHQDNNCPKGYKCVKIVQKCVPSS